MDQQVDVERVSDDTYSYTFATPIETADFEWLDSNRHVSDYSLKGNVLTITKTGSMDWISLNNNVIIPGLKRTFGSALKVNLPASSRR